MPTKKRAMAISKKAARKGKVNVRITYYGRPAKYVPDRHFQAKRAMAYLILAVALIVGVTAFYDAGYYTTGYATEAQSTHFVITAVDTSGGSASSNSFRLGVSMGEPAVGTGSSNSFRLTLGAMAYLGADTTPPSCRIKQSMGTPAQGATVTLTANCTDDTGLAEIALYTDENGTMELVTDYGSPAEVTGTSKIVTFKWVNPTIKIGTTVTWKVVAKDTSGNQGESTMMAFSIGAVPDTTPPVAGKPASSTTSPQVGDDVTITSQLSDDVNLSSADLIINGDTIDSQILTGQTATASFDWIAGGVGAYSIVVAANDAAGNTAESAPLTLTVTAAAVSCETTKPADVTGVCISSTQNLTTYTCDTTTGSWKPLQTVQACTVPTSPVAYIAVGVVALAVAIGAALYILKVKKPAAKKVKTRTSKVPFE
jgi:hypothetical protein